MMTYVGSGGSSAGLAMFTSLTSFCCSVRKENSCFLRPILVLVSMAPDLIDAMKASRASMPLPSPSSNRAESTRKIQEQILQDTFSRYYMI